MTRTDLILKLAEKEHIPIKAAKAVVDTLFDSMWECLERGERIEIRGFGAFSIREYNGYKGRNPKTGQIVDVGPKKLPFFKVGRELKRMVNTGAGTNEPGGLQ